MPLFCFLVGGLLAVALFICGQSKYGSKHRFYSFTKRILLQRILVNFKFTIAALLA
jgi:hypothetical protein